VSGDDATPDAGVAIGDRLDEIARERFDKSDWIELAAAFLLALATIMAAWAAYQSTRWSGVQANAYSVAGAKRVEASQATSVFAAQAQIDVETWLSWLQEYASGNSLGMDFLEARFRAEFKPAFAAWLALVPEGEVPPGTPFDLDVYQPAAEARAADLNEEAELASAEARAANQTSDNFVLAAVIMASVLFFAGVGTKFKGRRVRIAMLAIAIAFFVGGVAFVFSMPQNVGL
jgi:hypothetical protein